MSKSEKKDTTGVSFDQVRLLILFGEATKNGDKKKLKEIKKEALKAGFKVLEAKQIS